jgi:ketosteroid isomerase-like protein
MKTKFILVVCVALLPLTLICTAPAAGAKGADEQTVRDLDAAWSKGAAAKDLDKTVSFYSADAVVLPPNQAAASTKDGIRALWKDLIGSVTSVSWTATRVEMAKSGDMACLRGTYELTMNDGTKDRGKYCEVWEKKGGTWKCGTEICNSDLPATAAAPAAPEKK